MAVTIGLIAWRGDQLRSPGRIDSPVSREGAFLANNVLFAAFAFVVLLGTVFPLIVEAINGSQISVGSPYFNRMTMPIAIALLFLMAVAPVLPWRKASGELLRHRLLWPAWIRHRRRRARRAGRPNRLRPAPRLRPGRLRRRIGRSSAGPRHPPPRLARPDRTGQRRDDRAHRGRADRGGLRRQLEQRAPGRAHAQPGQTASFDGHRITYERLRIQIESNKTLTSAVVKVDGNGPYAPGIAAFREPDGSTNPVGTPSMYSTPKGDVALSLLALPTSPGESTITLRVTSQPLVAWLWIGGGVIAVGTALAAFPGRRRRPTQPVSAPVPGRRAAPPGDAPSSPGPPVLEPETVHARVEPA